MTKGERVIAVSGHARDYVLQHYPDLNPDRVVVIPRGVDVTVYRPGYRPDDIWSSAWGRQYPELENRFVITLPGRVSRRKGVLHLLKIVAGLRARGIPAHGLLVGDLPAVNSALARELRSAMVDAGQVDAITATGFREDVREIMSVSSAVLSLSLHPEAFGRTVNEALALGIPVAGYAHGGVGEQLKQHFPAGLVPPGDAAVMTERLADWSLLPPCMQDVQVYALQQMTGSTLALYRDLACSGTGALLYQQADG
jgi:glycosyltransferase involved in cell wall biosynthesis